MRSPHSPTVLVLLLASLLAGGAEIAGAADTDGGKAYAREQLVREARRMVRPDAVVATDLAALKAALAQDMKLHAAWQATTDEERRLIEVWGETIAARRLLLGDPSIMDSEGKPLPPTDGALADARKLLRWVLADVPEHTGCGVSIRAAGVPADDGQSFTYPTLPAVSAPGPANGAEAAPGGRPAGSGQPPAPVPPVAPAVPGTPTLEAWARAIRAAVGGALLAKELEPAVCDDVSSLQQAAATPTPIREPSEPGLKLKRQALETDEPFAYNAALVALRRLQAAERVDAFRADRPAQGLVDDGTVREKVQRAEAIAARLKTLEKQRDELLGRLDGMATDLDNWKTMAAILSVQIEDRRGQLAAAAPAPAPAEAKPSAPDLALRVLSGQETTVALEMRLLYLAAARSEARLGLLKEPNDTSGLLEQLIQATLDELAAARAVRALYEEELARVRRERRLDKLQSEARRLRARVEAMGSPESLSAQAALRRACYQALLEVNAVVQVAVRKRRALGDWATQVPVKAAAETRADDPVAFARDPGAAAWDAATLMRWRELLPRPAFDADLIAEHYAAGERRLKRLRATLRGAVDDAVLRERLATLTAAAERALAPLARSNDWALRTYRLQGLLDGWRRDFDDALSGMEQEKARIAERQAGIRSYQEALLALGTRSFGIRVVSDLDASDLSAAAGDGLDAIGEVRDWVTVAEPEASSWQFARDHWLGLLIVVATILLVIFGVPRVRILIERRLARWAMRFPSLRWGDASVSQERQDAKARKAQEAREAEELRRTVAAETPGAAPVVAAAAPSPSGPPPPDGQAPEARAAGDPAELPDEDGKPGGGVTS